jgi:hypothetical protein
MMLPEQHRTSAQALFAAPPAWMDILQPVHADFDHPSEFHGLSHTNRVMLHVLLLGHTGGLPPELIRRSYCAAAIHDQARTHDGYCIQHGAWSRESKLPPWTERFLKVGLADEELELVADAVEHHCIGELPIDHPSYSTLALLKDADALDRYRLGPNGLNLRFLRHAHAADFAPFAKRLVAHCWEVERVYGLMNLGFNS